MKIVFENEDNTIGVIHPTSEALQLLSINQIADKDTPEGLPYWIVEDSIIPSDRTYRDAWVLDPSWGEPHGTGGKDADR